MKKIWGTICLSSICLSLSLAVQSTHAEEKSEKPDRGWYSYSNFHVQPTPADKKTEKLEELGEWWLRNPLTYKKMPHKFLYHFEAEYSYDYQDGNWSTDNHKVNTLLSLRKRRFTNHLRYSYDRQFVQKPLELPDSDQDKLLRASTRHDFHEDFQVAINERIFMASGLFWAKDEYELVKDRYTYYIGAGYTVIKQPQFKFDVFGAIGNEETTYVDQYHETYLLFKAWGLADQINDYSASTEDYTIVLINEKINFFLSKTIMLKQEGQFIQDESNSDRYRWFLDIGVNVKMTEHFSLAVTFKQEYDNTKKTLMGVRERDNTLSTGLRVSF